METTNWAEPADLIHHHFPQLLRLFSTMPSATISLMSAAQLSFPAGDIRSVYHENQHYTVALSLLGLYGVDAPMPSYFLHTAVQQNTEGEIVRAFLTIFNQRLYQLFYNAWKKSRPMISLEQNDHRYLNQLAFISGNFLEEHDTSLFSNAGWLGRRVRSSNGLKAVLSHYLENIPVHIKQFIPRWINIVPDAVQKLGDNTLLGDAVLDISSQITIQIGPLTGEQTFALFPDAHKGQQLYQLVRRYLDRHLIAKITYLIDLHHSENFKLGGPHLRLGWLSVLGKSNRQPLRVAFLFPNKVKEHFVSN